MTSEEIRNWFNRIQKAQNLQDERSSERKQILKLYVGEFFVKPTDNSGDITEVNFLYEYVKTLIAAVYAKDPHIFARARAGRYYRFAETMERSLNYYWLELKLKKKIKSSILDGVLQPPGFIELGYLFIKENQKSEVQKELEEEFPELKAPQEPLEKFGIFDDTIKEDDVFAKQPSSWDVLWPDGYHDIRECPYMIIKERHTLKDVRANEMFKDVRHRLTGFETKSSAQEKPNKFRLKDTPGVISSTPQDNLDEENIEITLYRVFDKRTQKRFILAKNFDEDTLWEKDWKYLSEGFPIFPLIFNEIPRTDDKANSYPLSDVIPMLPQLKDLSKINTQILRHCKRSGTLILARRTMLPPDDIEKIRSSNDIDIVEVDSLTDQDLKTVSPPSLPNDVYRTREVVLEDLLRISGLRQLLTDSSGIETATESENVRAGSILRQTEKVDIIEEFTKDIARYLAGLLWQFKTREQISEILGEEISPEMWPDLPTDENGDVDIPKARQVIQKEIFFDIEAGSTRPPKDEAVERKQWMDLIGIIKANFPGRLKDDVILPQLLKKFDFKDIDLAVIGFDQQERERAAKENELLMQKIPIPVGPNDNHKIHMEEHAQRLLQGETTRELEEHTLEHEQFQQQLSPTQSPQQGDSRIAPQTTTPEQKRRGVPENVDFIGQLKERQPGVNAGRS